MKILIINQHSCNHGDEAAGKALARSLQSSRNCDEIVVSYNMSFMPESALYHLPGIKELYYKKAVRGVHWFLVRYLRFLYPRLKSLPFGVFPHLRKDLKAIRQADCVISGPGGVNLGVYFDVIYLWRLLTAYHLGKELLIYSPSFGPLPEKGFFRTLSLKTLNAARFFSLRDAQSQRYAAEYGISFIPSIDTAFLEYPQLPLPPEVAEMLTEPYVVLVPNQLYAWHPSFSSCSSEEMDAFYKRLIERFTDTGIEVVLLPQLFCSSVNKDEDYFRKLSAGNPRVTVISERYNSDIQQVIIRNSEFIVGARYHTIVFAINNKVPFFSLSYEHKMVNMLELLGLTEFTEDLVEVMNNPDICDRIFALYERRSSILPLVEKGHDQAKMIATQTFDRLLAELSAIEKSK